MTSIEATDASPRIEIEYENLEMPPRYVEGMQGLPTAQGGLQCYFFSDYVLPPPKLSPETRTREDEGSVSIDIRLQDPYGLQGGSVRILRRVEANIVLSETAARILHSTLGQLIEQMASQGALTTEQAES